MLALAQDDLIGTQSEISLPIYKRINPEWGTQKRKKDGSWSSPMSESSVNVGRMSWSVENSKLQSIPCKLFRIQSRWESTLYVGGLPTKAKVKPNLYFFAWVGLDGQLLKTTSSVAGIGQPSQIDAIYKKDSIDLTITQGKSIRTTSLFPSLPMERFSSLFVPMIEDGLVKLEKKACAMIHPMTGSPVTVDLKVVGRFQAKFMNLPFEGRYVEVATPKSVAKMAISRHGQLLAVSTPDDHEANAYISLSREEEDKWGKFAASEWDLPASITHPQRRRYKTIVAPVLINDPRLFMPIPCLVAI